MSPTYSICKNHGYLTGEQFKCPICGENAEVYSRITGYYRPVQNWNAGKTQEYKNRTEYTLEKSTRFSLGAGCCSYNTDDIAVDLDKNTEPIDMAKVEESMAAKAAELTGDGLYLFTTKTCPNCKLAREILKNEKYVLIDAEENIELARKYGIMQAPTLVEVNGENYRKYANVSNIRKYVEEHSPLVVV